jgi:hypothetical protein
MILCSHSGGYEEFNIFFKCVANLKYLGITLIHQKGIDEVKSILNSGIACYHSGQNPLSSVFYPKP